MRRKDFYSNVARNQGIRMISKSVRSNWELGIDFCHGYIEGAQSRQIKLCIKRDFSNIYRYYTSYHFPQFIKLAMVDILGH